MHKALVIKELRESAGLIAVAVAAAAYALADLTGVRLLPIQNGMPSAYPFVGDTTLTMYLCLLAGSLAILLGFKQSAWELWQNTYLFLLHRPASRTAIFATKLVVGIAVLLLVPGALIQLYAMWAATPGNHATPFFWSMTAWAWKLWFAFPLVYLGAFLSGIRPRRWFGSRLLPLATAGVLAAVAAAMPWWWLALAIVLVAAAAYVAIIFHTVQTRNF